MSNTRYTRKQAAADKLLREQYKAITLPRQKLEFMSRAPIGAIYLCKIDSDAEDLEGAWYPMLGGFQVADGKNRFVSASKEDALAHAEAAKARYGVRLQEYNEECAELQR